MCKNFKSKLLSVSILIVLSGMTFTGCQEALGVVDSLQDEPVTINEITVTTPEVGATPAARVTETDEFTGTVTWEPAHDTFAHGHNYIAEISLVPKDGFTLSGVPANFFTIAGADTTHAANPLIITASFPEIEAPASDDPPADDPPANDQPADDPPAIVSLSAISGVTQPVAGEKRVTTIEETAEFTGTVSWITNLLSGDKFASSAVYTATIILTPKTGYTLVGVEADFFTVIGAETVINLESSGVITATFPATAASINIKEISGVTPPVRVQTPVTAISDTPQFTGTVEWNPSFLNGKFAPGTVYTATIELTPKTGYTLSGVSANFFTVSGAETVSNPENSGVITATFPATTKLVSLLSVDQNGGTSETADSTSLTLTFDGDPTTLTADNITITGATKGALTGEGTTRTLGISDITVGNEEEVSVAITDPSGFTISGSPKTAVVYKRYRVGDRGPGGGIVFYVADEPFTAVGTECNTECEFLEAWPRNVKDLEDFLYLGFKWGPADTSIPGTSTAIGSGYTNTYNAAMSDKEHLPALIAMEWTGGGYNDWFLPSKDELNLLWQQKSFVEGFDRSTLHHNYWSSSQYNSSQAWFQSFAIGAQATRLKSELLHVRVIRAF